MVKKVRDAKNLISLFAWRKRFRSEQPIDIVILFERIEPFVHALEKRTALRQRLEHFQNRTLKGYFESWLAYRKNHEAIQKMKTFQKALILSKWKLISRKSMAAAKINSSFLVRKYLRCWRQTLDDKRSEVRLTGRLLRFNGFDSSKVKIEPRTLFDRASQMTSLKRALFIWREKIRLKVFKKTDIKATVATIFSRWRKRVEHLQWLDKTAEFHNKVRMLRPIFEFMKLQNEKYREALQYLGNHAVMKQKYEVLAKWRISTKSRCLKRRYFDTWSRKARFLLSADSHACRLSQLTTQLRCLQRWRQKSNSRAKYLKFLKDRENIINRRQKSKFFTHWREYARQIINQTQTVSQWKDREDRREYIQAWRVKAVFEHNCKAFRLKSIYRTVLDNWKGRLDDRISRHQLASNFFFKWRQQFKDLNAVRLFVGTLMAKNISMNDGIPSNIINRSKSIKSLQQSSNIKLMASCFNFWKKKSSTPLVLEELYSSWIAMQKKTIFKSIRLALRLQDYAEAQPSNELRRSWHWIKRAATRSRQRKIILELRLSELQSSRSFVRHFRFFKVWERAFQIRKMEEHLCDQNLMAYQHRQKAQIVKNWKQLTAQRMFQQYRSLINSRKGVLMTWRASAKDQIKNRDQRVLRRYLETWRSSLANTEFHHIRNQLQLRQKSRTLNKWRFMGRSKYDFRFNKKGPKVITPWFAVDESIGAPPTPFLSRLENSESMV